MTAPRMHGTVTPTATNADESGLLILLPSLGTTTEIWDPVIARLKAARPALRILCADLPGHGSSPTVSEPLSVSALAAGVLRLVEEIGGGRFWVAGVSLGGEIALELAITAGARVRGFAMFCSGAKIGTYSDWAQREEQVRVSGTASLVSGSAARWFEPGYLDRNPDGAGARTLARLIDVDDESYRACVHAVAGFDRSADLKELGVPALLVAGASDPVTTPTLMRADAAALPRSQYAEIAGASHLAVIECPDETVRLLLDFLDDGDPRSRGQRVRRAVLGDEHVDRVTAATTPETAPFQEFITRYAWGEIWSRPGLSRRERSIATLAVLVAGSHKAELPMHVRAALRNGLTRAEIAEVIMHTALYAGLPPANEALAVLREVLAEPNLPPPYEAGNPPRSGGTDE